VAVGSAGTRRTRRTENPRLRIPCGRASRRRRSLEGRLSVTTAEFAVCGATSTLGGFARSSALVLSAQENENIPHFSFSAPVVTAGSAAGAIRITPLARKSVHLWRSLVCIAPARRHADAIGRTLRLALRGGGPSNRTIDARGAARGFKPRYSSLLARKRAIPPAPPPGRCAAPARAATWAGAAR
jgi:hypothetical protein